MYKINDCIVYKRDVCKIEEIKEKYNNDTDYYVLTPIADSSLKINVPVDSNLIRDLISVDDINKLIKNIPNIETIDVDERMLETSYKNLLKTEKHEDLIKIIKTTYLRNKNRIDSNKKISEKDSNYFKLAEKFLYTELSVVLNKSFEDTKNYVINEVEKLV